MSNLAGAITKSLKAHKRKASDFYPTPADGTQAMADALGLPPGSMVADPCCGEGDMSRVLWACGYEVISADINDTGYGLAGYDYIGEDLEPHTGSLGFFAEYGLIDAIVINPPFSLAEQFIRKAVKQAPVVGVLLKADYFNSGRGARLWHDHPPTAVHPFSWRLPFLKEERGDNPIMNCTMFVWRRGDPPLPGGPLLRPDPARVPDLTNKPLLVHLKRLQAAFDRLEGVLDAL